MKSFEEILDTKENMIKSLNKDETVKEYTESLIHLYDVVSTIFPDETDELLNSLGIFKFLNKVHKKNELVKDEEISIDYEKMKVTSGDKSIDTMSIKSLLECLKITENRRGYYLTSSLLMNPRVYESILVYLFKSKFPN